MRLKEIADYRSKTVRRNYWPLASYIRFDGEKGWVDQDEKPAKHDPEKDENNERDIMWEEWNISMVPPPPPPWPVEVVEIKLEKHPDADTLSIVQVKGWTCVAKTSVFAEQTKAIYIPVDSILPDNARSRGALSIPADKVIRPRDLRIKSIKLRGCFSQGLLLPMTADELLKWQPGDNVCAELGIEKYEPPDEYAGGGFQGPKGLGGDCVPSPDGFFEYTKIQNYKNYPLVLEDNEPVIITEKIHGTNARFGLIRGEFFVGSHKTVKKETEESTYWKMAHKYGVHEKLKTFAEWYAATHLLGLTPDELTAWMSQSCIMFYGEIYGGNVQHLKYGLTDPAEHEMRLFDISVNGMYLDREVYVGAIAAIGLFTVPALYHGQWNKDLLLLASGKSFQGDHYREGCVIKPLVGRWDRKIGRVILKAISEEYYLDKKATDRH